MIFILDYKRLFNSKELPEITTYTAPEIDNFRS